MDAEAFKAGLARFGSGVTIITTRDAAGEPFGFTASSFTSVSLNPPLVLFCLARNANCFDAFEKTEQFAINILADGQQELSNHFAKPGEDKFQDVAYTDGASGMPLLPGTLAGLECATTQVVPGGDHLIFVGEVRQVTLGEGTPLFYYQGKYHTV